MERTLSLVTTKLERFIGRASRWANYISLGFLLFMPLPVFIDVIARLVFKGSIPGSIEIESFILLIIVFLGIAFVQFKEGHIRIGFIVSRFPKWIQNLLDCFNYLICTLFFCLMSCQLFLQGLRKMQDNVITYELEIPIWIFWFIGALGVFLLAIVVALDFLRSLQRSLEDKRWSWLILTLAAACFLLIAPLAGLAPKGLSGATAGILGMGFLFVLLFLGMPIGFGMAFTGLLGMTVVYRAVAPSLAMLGIGPFDTASSYMLTVVPMFILTGEFAYHSGISEDLFETAIKSLPMDSSVTMA